MSKSYRHGQILKLIRATRISTQEELQQGLKKVGLSTTQVTLSRDIRELGLVKVPLRDGQGTHFKYVEPNPGPVFTSRLHRIVAELVRSVEGSANLIVLRTSPGSAMMLASAIDEAAWPEIIGTIGGDDTVLTILKDAAQQPVVKQRFNDLLPAQDAR